MKKTLLGVIAVAALGSLLFSLGARTAFATDSPLTRAVAEKQHTQPLTRMSRTQKWEYSLARVSSKRTWDYESTEVSFNSQSFGRIGKIINGEVYIPLRKFVESTTGAAVSYSSLTRTLTVVGEGHNISVTDGAYAIYAAGRVIFSHTPSVILTDGRMYVPAASLALAFSLSAQSDMRGANLVGEISPVIPGSRYYDEDVIYWLSRIISAESRGESLLGQICVGNVILNRVSSSYFPNTVWGVIFDRKYGVQFTPTANGTIYASPTSSSVTAAKICLEGFSVSERAMYFLAPTAATSSWIENNREYLFTVGGHDFYA